MDMSYNGARPRQGASDGDDGDLADHPRFRRGPWLLQGQPGRRHQGRRRQARGSLDLRHQRLPRCEQDAPRQPLVQDRGALYYIASYAKTVFEEDTADIKSELRNIRRIHGEGPHAVTPGVSIVITRSGKPKQV